MQDSDDLQLIINLLSKGVFKTQYSTEELSKIRLTLIEEAEIEQVIASVRLETEKILFLVRKKMEVEFKTKRIRENENENVFIEKCQSLDDILDSMENPDSSYWHVSESWKKSIRGQIDEQLPTENKTETTTEKSEDTQPTKPTDVSDFFFS